ncbi:MAG: putative ABC transporter permease [Eggerthellaceae bacterium]|nr:putative ABC transporter permease [Eggerthellaceae bacterium]
MAEETNVKNELEGKGKAVKQTEEWNEKKRYPWFLRLYGVLCVIGGVSTLVEFVRGIVEFVQRDEIAEVVHEYTATTLVIAVIAIFLAMVLAVLFFFLGVRLLRGMRKRAAVICNIMIAISVIILICEFMIWGVNIRLIPMGISIVILIAVQSYSDPTLAEERELQHKLRKMETRQEAEDGTLGLDTTGEGYIKLNFFNLFWIFVIACVVGLILEVIWHMVVVDPGHYQDRAGLLYGPFSPIYGVGAVLMTIALNRFHDKNFIIIFLVAAVIGGAFEFFVSWFFETAFGIVAWDYSGTFLNIDGRTNFMFMCMWGVLGLVWVKLVMPVMLKIVNLIPWNWRYGITVVCAALMLVDCVLSLAAFDCWYQREAGTMDYEHASAITQFCNDNFDNEFMTNRFQSMTMNPDSASRAN